MRARAILAALFAIGTIGGPSLGPVAAGSGYVDADGHRFEHDIAWATAAGITDGCGQDRYCPDQPVTRAQMASFIARMFELPAADTDAFPDDDASIHEADIDRVAAAGIAVGCSSTAFCPARVVSRAEMATFLARADRLLTGAGRNYFSDDDASVHEGNIDRAAAAGITRGCGTYRFCPAGGVLRGEMAALLHRVVEPVSPPPHPAPSPTPPPPASGAAVLVGAGDIARCGSPSDDATATVLDSIDGTVFTAGDNVEGGTATQYATCYADSWGRHEARTRPAPGNHEYDPGTAAAYFDYFGAAAGPGSQGWYSYDLGAWHVIVLNSECDEVGGCGASSAQTTWLHADLAASDATCTVAIFHRPLFTSSQTTGSSEVRPLWQALYEADADVVVNGHAHLYERMAPQTPSGVRDDDAGIRQFIVGTGGHRLHNWRTTIHPNSEARDNQTFGVLELTLRDGGYDWRFVPVEGRTFSDRGSDTCH